MFGQRRQSTSFAKMTFTHESKDVHFELLAQRFTQTPPILLGPKQAMANDQALVLVDILTGSLYMVEIQIDCIRWAEVLPI